MSLYKVIVEVIFSHTFKLVEQIVTGVFAPSSKKTKKVFAQVTVILTENLKCCFI